MNSDKHTRIMNRFEREFITPVHSALRSQIKAFIDSGMDLRKLDEVIINDRVAEVIRDLYTEVGIFYANQTLRELTGQQKKGFGFNLKWTEEILRYFALYLLNKAVLPITETTKEQIRQIMEEGQREGWGVDRIVRELNSSELTLWRARTIVRTETAKAAFYGDKLGESESEFESTKMWISAKDHRTRHSHRQMNGKVLDWSDKFAVPVFKDVGAVDVQIGIDLMEGPGDPNAHKANVINCRCTLARRLKKVNGRLVPKTGIKSTDPMIVDMVELKRELRTELKTAVDELKSEMVVTIKPEKVDYSEIKSIKADTEKIVKNSSDKILSEVKGMIPEQKEYDDTALVSLMQGLAQNITGLRQDMNSHMGELKNTVKKPKKFEVHRDEHNKITEVTVE